MYRDPRTTKIVISAERMTCPQIIRNHEVEVSRAVDYWKPIIAFLGMIVLPLVTILGLGIYASLSSQELPNHPEKTEPIVVEGTLI